MARRRKSLLHVVTRPGPAEGHPCGGPDGRVRLGDKHIGPVQANDDRETSETERRHDAARHHPVGVNHLRLGRVNDPAKRPTTHHDSRGCDQIGGGSQ